MQYFPYYITSVTIFGTRNQPLCFENRKNNFTSVSQVFRIHLQVPFNPRFIHSSPIHPFSHFPRIQRAIIIVPLEKSRSWLPTIEPATTTTTSDCFPVSQREREKPNERMETAGVHVRSGEHIWTPKRVPFCYSRKLASMRSIIKRNALYVWPFVCLWEKGLVSDYYYVLFNVRVFIFIFSYFFFQQSKIGIQTPRRFASVVVSESHRCGETETERERASFANLNSAMQVTYYVAAAEHD